MCFIDYFLGLFGLDIKLLHHDIMFFVLERARECTNNVIDKSTNLHLFLSLTR